MRQATTRGAPPPCPEWVRVREMMPEDRWAPAFARMTWERIPTDTVRTAISARADGVFHATSTERDGEFPVAWGRAS